MPGKNPKRSRYRFQCGFTLVELLITILVIGILSAMILPAISKSRNLARKATCASNLKQIGTAFGMYLEDYRHWMPKGEDWHHRLNELYLRSVDVFSCPAEKIDITAFDVPQAQSDLSYGINVMLVGWDRIPPIGYTPSMYSNYDGITTESGEKILIADNRYNPEVFNEYQCWISQIGPSFIGDRHNKGANVLFTDFHVEWVLNSTLQGTGYYPAKWTYDGTGL